MLRQFYFLALFVTLTFNSSAQEYVPFPTDSASWNGSFLDMFNSYVSNYTYHLQGDTVINETNYKKLFFTGGSLEFDFIGGLREDSLKNIYFYASELTGEIVHVYIPEIEQEYLIYAFDNLEVGMETPLGTQDWSPSTQITDIDSILVQGSYRKRYEIDSYYHWIEGIGSTKDLLSIYAIEFEWSLNSVCYTDNNIGTFFFEPYDSCSVVLSVDERNAINFKLYPNPVKDIFTIESDHYFQNGRLSIYNSIGQTVMTDTFSGYQQQVNSTDLTPGMYILLIRDEKQDLRVRIVKE